MWQFWAALVIILLAVWYFTRSGESFYPFMKYDVEPAQFDDMSPIMHSTKMDAVYMSPMYIRETINKLIRDGNSVNLKFPPEKSHPTPDNVGMVVGIYQNKRYLWSTGAKKWIPEPNMQNDSSWLIYPAYD